MRNSTLSMTSGNLLAKYLTNPDYYLTGLNMQFCFLTFEHFLALSNAMNFNKTLVKLNLSNNGLKSCMLRFFNKSIINNLTLTELNLSSNFLDDEFAFDFAEVLAENQVLYKVDISKNPIGPEGAAEILGSLLKFNDTLGSLGDLEQNIFMGVRIREELKQALAINNSTHD